jgi:putative ABC transport system permease protein
LLARQINRNNPGADLPLTGATIEVPSGAIPIWISEPLARRDGLQPGMTMQLPLMAPRNASAPPPTGVDRPGVKQEATQIAPSRDTTEPREIPSFVIAGVWRDYSRQHGAVVLSSRDWVSLTGDESQSDLALWLSDGVDEEAARQAVAQAVPGAGGLELRSAREIRAISLRVFDRSFAVTWVLEAVAIAVALFGVAAAWSGEALAREREFGVLRHLGFTRRQVLRAFTLESGLLILIAVLWGACLGAAIAVVLVHRVNPQSFHWTMDMHWPTGILLVTGLSLVGLGMLAARLAGRSATRASPIRSLREDW